MHIILNINYFILFKRSDITNGIYMLELKIYFTLQSVIKNNSIGR